MELKQEHVNVSIIMPKIESDTTELEQVEVNSFEFILKLLKLTTLMRYSKTLMRFKDFSLSCWMLVDIISDIITCYGFFRKWKVSQNKFFKIYRPIFQILPFLLFRPEKTMFPILSAAQLFLDYHLCSLVCFLRI